MAFFWLDKRFTIEFSLYYNLFKFQPFLDIGCGRYFATREGKRQGPGKNHQIKQSDCVIDCVIVETRGVKKSSLHLAEGGVVL